MTVNEDEIDARIEKLKQQTRKVVSDIDNFNVDERPVTELHELFKVLEKLKEDVEDEINNVEVEDFLLNGAGIKNKNI